MLAPVLARLLRALATRSTPVRIPRAMVPSGFLIPRGPRHDEAIGEAHRVIALAAMRCGLVYESPALARIL